MTRRAEPDPLTVERWHDLAASAELPRLDEETIRLVASTAAGPGDLLRALLAEALAVRRRRRVRVAADGRGNIAVGFDVLGEVPPWLPPGLVEAERRGALARIADAVRGELGLPWPAVADLLGVPSRTLRRWVGQRRVECGPDCAPSATPVLRSSHNPRSRRSSPCRHR